MFVSESIFIFENRASSILVRSFWPTHLSFHYSAPATAGRPIPIAIAILLLLCFKNRFQFLPFAAAVTISNIC